MIEDIKQKIEVESQENYENSLAKFYLNWDIQFLEGLKSFERLIASESKVLIPTIDPELKAILNESNLEMLWLNPTELIRTSTTAIYIPAILSLFGWKAQPDSECGYKLV